MNSCHRVERSSRNITYKLCAICAQQSARNARICERTKHDNAPAHTPLLVRGFLAKNNTITSPRPPYSPDLAPLWLFWFPKLMRPTKRRRHATIEEIETAPNEEPNKITDPRQRNTIFSITSITFSPVEPSPIRTRQSDLRRLHRTPSTQSLYRRNYKARPFGVHCSL